MGDLSKDFSRSEFACHCGCDAFKLDKRLLDKLQIIRNCLHRPLQIASGYRCEEHNKAVGGAPNSAHLFGIAVDISCKDSEFRAELLREAYTQNIVRYGIGKDFIHLDLRKVPCMWLY